MREVSFKLDSLIRCHYPVDLMNFVETMLLLGVLETGKANGAIFHLILNQIAAFQRKENPLFSVSRVLFLKATWPGGQSAGLTIDKQYLIEIYDPFFGN